MFSKVKSAWKNLRLGRSSSPETSSSSNNPASDSIILHTQRLESNEEDVTIVWLNRHANTMEMKSLMGSTRSINDYIQVPINFFFIFFYSSKLF